MRNKLMMLTATLLLVPGLSVAQTSQAPRPAAAASASPFTGGFDFGGMFTTVDGDEARFERYRDTRDGAYANLDVGRESKTYIFGANAYHIGYRDQRYNAEFQNKRIKFGFNWTSLPLNYSYLTRTAYSGLGTDTLTLPDSAQAAVQGPTNATNDGTAVGVPCAPGAPPAACGTAAQVQQAISTRSIYNSLATQFDLRQKRDTAMFDLNYAANKVVDVDAHFKTSARNGGMPWGASFAFNDAVELVQPLDQRTNDVTLGTTWAKPKGMFRVAWDGSWFTNNIPTLTWDNPIRATDFNNGLAPPLGPYDPNGYSNGNGPVQGREALPPNNVMNVVSGSGLYKLPHRTTVNGTLQLSNQRQNEALIPWTINSVINTPAVFAAFPGISELPRQTAEAEAQGINALINLSSRPSKLANVTVRYRYNKHDVKTPIFDASEYVRFDAVPEEAEEGHSTQFDTTRHIFDANLAVTPMTWGTFRVGYGHEAVARQGRGFSDVGENIFRVSFDTYSNQYVTARASYDYGKRRGQGFVEAESGNDEAEVVLGPGGTQPTLRYYDEADRNRKRGSIVVTVMPTQMVEAFVQYSRGQDEYLADESVPVSRPGELFGLQNSKVESWNVGVNVHPTNVLAVGASYGHDDYTALQLSRNANPPPDPTWTDPTRNWTLDNDEQMKTFNIYLDLLRAMRNTDIRFGYDYSDSDNAYVHGGPRIAALTALNQFIPLPNVTNTWQRAMVDVQYYFNAKTGVAVGYYFDKLEISDFNTVDTNGPVGFAPATGEPRIDWLGGLMTGYGNRPYRGNSASVRLLYRF
jgi:MtrB/PioB family decaheme-associated outer membrane protein